MAALSVGLQINIREQQAQLSLRIVRRSMSYRHLASMSVLEMIKTGSRNVYLELILGDPILGVKAEVRMLSACHAALNV